MVEGTTTDAQRELEGKYTIGSALGSGAGGETFEAIDVRDGSRVALKRLGLTTTREWKAVELFQREARVLAALNHPSIPRLRDSFVVDAERGPVSYLVHDFAPGHSLRGWMESGWRPDEREVIRIGCFLLDVLAYLHALKPPVIHRDIKPANVIRSEDGRLWLVDFGSVRDATVTMTGGSTVVGTYGYMAPEQFRGHAVVESDLYGVGATLLYLLSGRPPTEFPQAKLKTSFRGRVQTSEQLAQWIERVLEPAPEDRFPSAVDALAALRGERSALRAKPARLRATTIALLSALGALVAGTAGIIANDLRNNDVSTRAQFATNPPALPPPRPPSAFKVLRKGRLLEQSHTSPIFAMARSTDGKKFATGSERSAKIWDFERGTVERVLAGHEAEVRGIAFTPDDSRVVTAGGESIRIWDAETGAQLGVLTLPGVSSVKVTPDAKHIVASAFHGIIRVYDLAKQEMVRELAHGSAVESLTLSPDGSQVASGGRDGSLKFWALADGRALGGWSPHTTAINAIAFSPDGRSIVTVGDDHAAHLTHFKGAAEPSESFSWNHDDIVFGVTFSPDGNRVFTTGREGMINTASAMDGHVVAVTHDRNSSKAHPFFSNDGGALVVAAGSYVMRFPVPRRGLGTQVPEPAPERAVAPTPKDRDRELYSEATRLMRQQPRVPLSEAEKKVREALASNPSSQLAWIANARHAYYTAYVRENVYDSAKLALARKHLDHAATLGPKGVEWWTFSAWLSRAEMRPDVAREAVRRARAVAPGEPDVIFAEAELDLDDGQFEKVISSVSELIRTKPLGYLLHGAYGQLARAYDQLGDIDGADAAHRRILGLDARNAWERGNYATFLIEQAGELARGIDEARAALDLMDYGVGRSILAAALIERGNDTLWGHGSYDDAIRDYEEAMRLQPSTEWAYYGRAAVYRRRAIERREPRFVAMARADLERIVKVRPDWKGAKRALAELDAVEALAKRKM